MQGFKDCEMKDAIGKDNIKIGDFIIVEANSDKGFNFGYVVFVPNEIDRDTTLIVEGANTGKSLEDIRAANKDVLDSSTEVHLPIYYIASETNMPILTPLFPRVRLNNKTYYTHMLTSDVLKMEDEKFIRLDNQLIAMFEDVKDRFEKSDINIQEKFVINGFSASGKFANRFTILHPDKVCLCVGGGVSGCLTLPIRQINGEQLLYPVGIGNIKEFTDEQYESFLNVRQFYYMGLEDDNDPYSPSDKDPNQTKHEDIISIEEMKQLHKFLGLDMTTTRWETTQKYYKEIGVNAEFESYEGFGHRPHPATKKITTLLKEVNKNNKHIV